MNQNINTPVFFHKKNVILTVEKEAKKKSTN